MSFSKYLLILLIVLSMAIAIPSAFAKEYHITLLTVGETDNGFIGGTADAYLEMKPGTGRIFLDSFPATKLDTQISTRYANKIACDYLNENCEKYDFFYTIRADSTIVGGPSASAPLTILTIAALKGLTLKNETVMTGTINSGGSIGPVGGIVAKVQAAQGAGFKTALIPKFAIIENESEDDNTSKPVITGIRVTTSSNRTNKSTEDNVVVPHVGNFSNKTGPFGNLSITIVRVSNLDEAIPYFMDLKVETSDNLINVPAEYVETMHEVADLLCTKAASLKARLNLSESDLNKSLDFERRINSSMNSQNYYSAASFCFNMGVMLRRINLNDLENANPKQIQLIRLKALEALRTMDSSLEKKNLTTLPELETYIIVKERLLESEKMMIEGGNNITTDSLAYAIERYYSAVYWSSFFNVPGKLIDLDESHLEDACHKKISEAEERINYANLYLPSVLMASRSELDEAYVFSKDKNFKMCLFKASFAKAEANLLLSSIAVGDDKFSDLSLEKLAASHKLVSKEEKRGFFPIMGYSYYEYALSLNKNHDEVSSLIFAEYSLELSNLEIYFPKRDSGLPAIQIDLIILVSSVFLFGLFLGMLIAFTYLANKARARAVPAVKKKRARR